MAIKIQFDDMHTPEAPTLVLSKYSGEKLGVIEATSIELSGKFNDASEIHFTVYKEFCHLWDEIRDFRLCWAKEWDKWFQMKVTITDEEATVKNVECRQLGHAELSQVNLHDLQINTEDDIDRDDYNENEPHTFYNERYLENSILYRVMNKVPHYSIKHVDYSVGSLYGVFTFDGVSVLDAFKQLEEEFDCLIVINSGTNEDGTIERSVSVYDLETLCLECGHRGVFTDVCEDCGSTDIKYGYGDDTTIYIDKENLASSVEFSTDNDSVKNCFRLVAGDDLMTDTIIQTNPNGSQYLWFVTDEMKEDMSTELVAKIADYDESYDYYLNDYVMTLPQELVTEYNGLVAKYLSYNEDLISLESSVIGYEKLMDLEYDVIDFELFLQTSFMPAPELMNTTAEQQAALLNRNTMGTVAVTNLDACSKATASNAVMSVAKAIIDPRYSAKIKTDAYDLTTHIWTGVITVQNYSNEDDKMDSAQLVITINGDESLFIKQQILRALDKKIDVTKIDSAYDAKALFALSLSDFKNELKIYGVDSLSAFEQMGQSCLDVMQSYGASIDMDWNRAIYDALYIPYSDKVLAIQEELQLREQEVAVIKRMHDEVITNKQTIRSVLNMEAYFGETLWNEFISFCREDDYRNDNYISDGLSNVELFEFARNFVRTAKKELYKSATLQHSISTTLSNLLVMKEFEPIVDYFQLGNWIRVKCDDEIYKLRLISYTINFDNPENIEVEFSDVKSVATGISDIESIIDQASSMSSSYQSIERQASKGDAASKQMTNWFERGLDATLSKIVNNADDQTMVMDDHGLLMREYNPETDEYNNEQLKIINSTIAITDDNWRSTKTAVGKFYYYDFNTGRLKQTFGINGETVVGKLLVGEALGLYNSSATLKFDENGLYITNGTNTFTVNPNSDVLLAIAKGNDSLLSVNDAGNLTVSGDLVANTLATGGRLSSAVGQSGMYIDSDGNVYSGRANEFMVTSEGKLYAKDADIEGTVKATNGTFSGAISSSTYSAGEKIAKDVKKNGLFIDSDGSIYGGPDNQVTIKPDGTFQFGGTNGVIYNGSTLSVTGNITANTLSTGGRPSASTGHDGIFIDSDGNLYSGSNNGVILYNNGQFNLANKITYNGSIVSIAGDVVIGGSDSASQIITNITNAQATADSKTHVFYGSPNDTHSGVSIGDYLIDKSDGCTYKWTGTDWDRLTNYSKAIDDAIKNLNESLTAQLDDKIDTWAQSTDPSSSWTTEDKPKHDKDLWYYTGTSITQANEVNIEPSKTYQYNATTNKWVSYNNPSVSLFDYVDGKSTIYYGKKDDHTTGIEEGDYLVDSSDGCTYRWDDENKTWVEVTKTGTLYATCDTDAPTDKKVAQCNKAIALYEGLVVSVKFAKANTSTSALTLKVGDLAAKYIQVGNSNTSSSNKLLWSAGATITFIYNGEKWLFADQPQTYNASCATAADTAAKSSSVSNAVVVNGTTANVTFTYSNTASNATLDITNTSDNAAIISANGTSLSATSQYNWNAGATASFTFDGTKWIMNNTSALYNTNSYMKFESSGTAQGLMIANMTGGVVGNSSITSRNVLLQSDGLKIRNGQKLLASYGDSIIMYKPGTKTEAVNISLESATFNGIINATSGSFGGFTIDSDSIYSGIKGNSNSNSDITLSTADFKRTIGGVVRPNLKFAIGANFGVKNDGTIYVGDGIFKGSVTATSLSTGSRTSSNTGTNGTYIDSYGNIYIGSANDTMLYANGGFQFGGSNGITYDGSNVTLGTNVKLSWSNITDPHETQLPDWVEKVTTEISGDTVKTTNVYAADIIGDTIHGKNIYTGSHDETRSTEDGAYIASDGAIYVGPYDRKIGSCPFEVSKSGNLTARNVDITGDITANSLTLNGSASIPYSNISNTPNLNVYIKQDNALGTLPADTATSSTDTGFKVSSAGLLTASNARIFGTIYATAGKFTGDVKANTLKTGTKTSSTSGTGTYIDSTGAIYSGSNSNNYFYVSKEGKFQLGGDNGIRYVTSNNIDYIYLGKSIKIQASNGAISINDTTENQQYFKFETGLWIKGDSTHNVIADGCTIRSTNAIFVGSGNQDTWPAKIVKIVKDDGTITGEANFAMDVSVKDKATSQGAKVISLLQTGEITCKKLSSTGDIGCSGTLTCGSFSPSSIIMQGEIKTSNSYRYARMANDDPVVVETVHSSTRYVRMTTGGNSAFFDVHYSDNRYIQLDGYYGIAVQGSGITASGTISGGSLSSGAGLSLSGAISGATTINATSTITGNSLESKGGLTLKGAISGATTIGASSTITGGSLVSKGGLTLSGEISGATNILATSTVTANKFDGDIVTMAGDTRRPIGSTATKYRFTNVIGTRSSGVLSVEGQFGGSSYSSHTYAASDSDARLKKDISNTLIKGLDIVRNIQHRQFTWKHDGHHDDIGYIAQELECINKGLVYHPETENEYYSINTLFLQAVTTKALQELITEVDTLKSRIDELERTKGEINES